MLQFRRARGYERCCTGAIREAGTGRALAASVGRPHLVFRNITRGDRPYHCRSDCGAIGHYLCSTPLRGVTTLLANHDNIDYTLYQALIELDVQILLVLGREADALVVLEEAREKLPNNPTVARWITKLEKNRPRGEA